VRGVAYEIPGVPDVGLALRENAAAAAGIAGYDPIIFAVADDAAIEAWSERMRDQGIEHRVVDGTIGQVLVFHDPDGTEIHLYSRQRPAVDNAGKPGVGRAAG
jgi:hypothetical protein